MKTEVRLQPSLAEEALSLEPESRADLARLLVQSLEGDPRGDQVIRDELASRLRALTTGQDPGLTFAQVFGTPG